MEKQTRKIKLQPKSREQSNGQKVVPWLNVSGCWLEELGFKPGDLVEITTRERLLIIQPVSQVQEKRSGYEKELRALKQQLKKLL